MSLLSIPIKHEIELTDEWGKHYRFAQTTEVRVDPMRAFTGEIRYYDVRLMAPGGECLWWTMRLTFEEAEKVARDWRDEVERQNNP